MAHLRPKWQLHQAPTDICSELAAEAGISPFLAGLLYNRGIADAKAANAFLHGKYEDLPDPFLLRGMAEAIARIRAAVAANEKITVYGDYDVDGITSTALLLLVLREKLGAHVDYYIPDRCSEGYGLNTAALQKIAASGTTLVITVDAGISAAVEIASAAMDIIVTDHHEPPDELPNACAVVNPRQPGCSYPDKDLSGVGVAFKLCQALMASDRQRELLDYLDLVALGTIADIVPLVEENRILVQAGLKQLNVGPRMGIKALLAASGVKPGSIDSTAVAFMLVPRLNAAGRLGSAAQGVELLTAADRDEAQKLAKALNALNVERQAICDSIMIEAERDIVAEVSGGQPRVLVIAGKDWHPGAIGIVASRFVDKYYCPVVMISVTAGVGKGSCRSIPGFNIYEALSQCAGLLQRFGGHAQAAGLTVAEEQIPALRARLAELAAEMLTSADYVPKIDIDCSLPFADINDTLLAQLAQMEPFGMGNKEPILMCTGVAVKSKKAIGRDGKHLKLQVEADTVSCDAISWNKGYWAELLTAGEKIDLAFIPGYNEWQGIKKIQLKACDFHVGARRVVDKRNSYNPEEVVDSIAKSGSTLVYAANKHIQQSAGVLCITPADDLPAARFTNIALLAPPLDCIALAGVLATDGGSVYLLYGHHAEQVLRRQWTNLWPGRQELVAVYMALRALGGYADIEALAAQQSCRKKGLDFIGIHNCLQVFLEIKLVSATEKSGFMLQTMPQHKLDLQQSPSFCAYAASLTAYEKKLSAAMALSVNDVCRCLQFAAITVTQEGLISNGF